MDFDTLRHDAQNYTIRISIGLFRYLNDINAALMLDFHG